MLSVYKASAGSGKTFTLAYEFIKMLLGRKPEGSEKYGIDRRSRDRHRRLLAITFTNKATDEMKRRILHELAVLAGCEPAYNTQGPYMEMLTRDLGTTPDVIAAEARRALEELLFDYSSFNISTIDSFFQSILRTFAREAELAGNYEVDLDDTAAVTGAVAETFRSIGENDERKTLEWMTQIMLAKARAGEAVDLFNRSSTVFSELVKFISTLSGETYMAHAAAMEEYFHEPGRLDRFYRAVAERRRKLIGEISAKARNAVALLENAGGANTNLVKKLQEWSTVTASSPLPKDGSTVPKVAADVSAAFTAKFKKNANDPAVASGVADACQAITEGTPQLNMLRILSGNLHFMGLAGAVAARIETFRRENNTLLLSDTNSLLRRIIGDDETPFVYERMGIWIDHYLIDEFQDTSRLQWENLRPLVAEGLSTDKDSLIIGDEKQCIYRFRNSDPELLTSGVSRDLPDRTTVKGAGPGENTNWRSSRTVVEFNNALFTYWARKAGFGDTYANVEQLVSPAHTGHQGYVDIRRIADRKDAMDHMCDEITRQLSSGYKPKDIAVLTRNRSEGAEAISAMLARIASDPQWKNVRIISDDAITLGSSPAIRQVICAMRRMLLARLSADRKADNTGKRKLNHTLGQELRARLANRFEHHTAAGMSGSDALRKAVVEMRDIDSIDETDDFGVDLWEMRCPSLPTLVARLIDRCISPTMYAREQAYLSALIDTVNDFAERGTGDLQGFLDWWDESGRHTPLAAPQDDNALRVMTIHKSKGLEFHCVHIPVASWDISKLPGCEWFVTPEVPGIDPEVIPPVIAVRPVKAMTETPFADQYERLCREQLLDEINVAYVAFTRAVDELIVTYSSTRSGWLGELIEEALNVLPEDAPEEPENPGAAERIWRSGRPTTPHKERVSLPTALDPTMSEPMSKGRAAALRPRLWEDIKIDSDAVAGESARRRGIMMHDILAGVRSSADLHRAVRRMVRRRAVPLSIAESIETHLAELIASQAHRGWFDGYRSILTERAIASGEIDSYGNAVRTRPDRIVWTCDGYVDVIDYKTGEERDSAYSRQVKGYMRSMRSLGYTNIRGFIWYLDTNTVRQVSLTSGDV